MKQLSIPGTNSKKHFQIRLDPGVYSIAERCGYSKAIFEGEDIKGSIEVELAKPENVKCIRIQLIGYISKSKSIGLSEVLKYVNNPENPGTFTKAMKMVSKDSDNNSPTKYDNLSILVDYDIIVWGKMKQDGESSKQRSNSLFNQFAKGIKATLSNNKEENYESRKEMINHKFIASRLDCERLELPFSFKLRHISNEQSTPLPSSYINSKCHIEYFLYATIHKPWPSRNSVRLMKLRVLQKIKTDIPSYIKPLEEKKIKELKFMKYIKKGLIEMNVKIPHKAFCHRDNIPIEVSVNHLGTSRTINGFAVGLYEECCYEDINTKKFVKSSFKLISERFYEYLIKPGESDVSTILNFPLVDGNCTVQKKYLKSNFSTTVPSNTGSDENIKEKNDEDDEDLEEEEEEAENDITRMLLKDVKIPVLSATIDEPSRWPVRVRHKLRVVAISNENINKIIRKMKEENNEDSNDNEPQNNDYEEYEEYKEIDSQVYIHVSPPTSPLSQPANSNNSLSSQNTNYLSSEQSINERRPSTAASSVSSSKDLITIQGLYSDSQKYNNENKKYGVILGQLSLSNDARSLPKSRKALDFEFDIVIATMTKTPRLFGKEFKLEEEIEDQYINAILRKTNSNSRIRIRNASVSSTSSKVSQKKDDEPDIKIHTRIRTNSSSNGSFSEMGNSQKEEINTRQRLSPIPSASVLPNSGVNKELPVAPIPTDDDNKNSLPQQVSDDNNNSLPQQAPDNNDNSLPQQTTGNDNNSLPQQASDSNINVLPQQPPTLPQQSSILQQPPILPQQPPVLPQQSSILQQPQVLPQQPSILQPQMLPQQPPVLPMGSTTSFYSTPGSYYNMQPQYLPQQLPYQQMFPGFPQFANPQEYYPSAPTIEEANAPPPPYEYSVDDKSDNNQYPKDEKKEKIKE